MTGGVHETSLFRAQRVLVEVKIRVPLLVVVESARVRGIWGRQAQGNTCVPRQPEEGNKKTSD